MGRYLDNFSFDRVSFWLGFLAGILVLWLVGKARPWFSHLLELLRLKVRIARENITATTEIRLRNDIIRHCERIHLAAPLFSLSEIIIQPRLLAPPAPIEPGKPQPIEDLTAQTIPFLPDWPEIAAEFNAPTFTLAEALQGGANLVLTGRPGSGRSVTLAHLATQMAKQDSLPGQLEKLFPLPVNAADIILPPKNPDKLLDNLEAAISNYASSLTMTRLSSFLEASLTAGQVLILCDGLDELPPESIEPVVSYFDQLLQKYPKVRIVTTADSLNYRGLPALGFIPIPMAIWGVVQKEKYLEHWNTVWQQHIETPDVSKSKTDPVLINAWLVSDRLPSTPLEFTLKVWAAYAGDNLGPHFIDSIEAYIRRMTVGASGVRAGLENLSYQAIITRMPFFSQKDAQTWVSAFETQNQPSINNQDTDGIIVEVNTPPQQSGQIAPVSRILSISSEKGLLHNLTESRMGLIHPLILSYLASACFKSQGLNPDTLVQDTWITQINAASFVVAQQTESPIVTRLLEENCEPLHKELFITARWLPLAMDNAQWRTHVMRNLASILQTGSYPNPLRSSALIALAASGMPGVNVLFRQILASDQTKQRQIAALGSGYIQDIKAVDDLNELLGENNPSENCAACLALVSIGTKQSLEYVADALLGGSDDVRRSAAEALANSEEQGYPTLKEGAELDDVLVRKAVISGLQRLRQQWATQLIEKLYVGDEEWVVKDAASQALKELSLPNPRIPKPYPPTHNLPWLIAFGGERGIGVAPGKAAWDLLIHCLKEGKEEQRAATINYLAFHGDASVVMPLYHILYSNEENLADSAYNALWHLGAAGVELPNPVQYGLGYSD